MMTLTALPSSASTASTDKVPWLPKTPTKVHPVPHAQMITVACANLNISLDRATNGLNEWVDKHLK